MYPRWPTYNLCSPLNASMFSSVSALQLQEANTGELKCNCFKNTSTLLFMENIFCEPSLLTKYLKQLHPCREEAGCATCPNSSHQLLSCPSLAGQPWHHKVDRQRQNSKQATMAEENKHGSVSSTVEDSAFHSGAVDNSYSYLPIKISYNLFCSREQGAEKVRCSCVSGALHLRNHRCWGEGAYSTSACWSHHPQS